MHMCVRFFVLLCQDSEDEEDYYGEGSNFGLQDVPAGALRNMESEVSSISMVTQPATVVLIVIVLEYYLK